PVGHDLQLGLQRPPTGQVAEYFEIPTPRELWEKHVRLYRPAVLRGALNGSPALNKWSDDYLSKNYGDQEVLVEKKYEDRRTEPKRMRIDAFLRNYTEHQWYTVSMMPEDMRKDIKVPKPLMCSTFRYNLQELNLWIGTKGTRSMLHHDADNIFHCLVTGRKDWILINADQRAKIDMVLQRSNAGSGFSHLNVDNVDLFEHHELSQVPWEYATLYAGDCLYLPSQYTHQVRSYNRSISSTFLSFPRDTFDDSDCSDVDLDSYLSLDDVYVYWVYEKGQETVNMGYGNPEDTITVFRNLYELLKVDKLALNGFFYAGFVASGQGVMEKVDDVNIKGVDEAFSFVDTNMDGLLHLSEIVGLSQRALRRF
uniref:JmjC domain-containing protein n=1 Tax=Ciona intestinalis TaxID=7719 RepID=F6TZA0_CIOIN